MKTLAITLNNGKIYTGISNGKIYGNKVYLNRPAGGFITANTDGVIFETSRSSMIFETSEIKSAKSI